MALSFEISGEIGQGNSPDFIEFPDTIGQIVYLENGLLRGKPTEKLKGSYTGPTWLGTLDINPSSLSNSSFLNFDVMNRFGVIGSCKSGNTHKLLIYEFQQDVSEYLDSGSISYDIDNAISSFNLSLENPIDPIDETKGNIAISENSSLISPGSKLVFNFKMGDSEIFELGTFYVDRSNFNLRGNTISVDGRNIIGKVLKDQSLNTDFTIAQNTVSAILSNLLKKAFLTRDDFLIQDTSEKRGFIFEPRKDIFSTIEDILQSMINWKMEERADGTIVIGAPSYSAFDKRSAYIFNRNKDIFSRQITRDDQQAYRKVCVHDKDYKIHIYEDVKSYSGWNLQENKTLFVEVAEGTRQTDARNIAKEIARRLENVGKIETFTGPFRPQLLVGDSAKIINGVNNSDLGLITSVSHSFGKGGFTTNFIVDSGGTLGRGRLSDFINMLGKAGGSSSISYEDILPEEPTI